VQRQVELAQDERAELTAVHTKTHGAGAEACRRRTREKRAPPMGVEDEGRAEAAAAAEQEERRAEEDQLVAWEGRACPGGVDGQSGRRTEQGRAESGSGGEPGNGGRRQEGEHRGPGESV